MAKMYIYIGLLVVIVIVLYRYVFSKKHKLTNYTLDGQTETQISADTLNYDSSANTNSSNFCYSVWFYIQDWNYKYGDPKTLFSRGGKSESDNPCPMVNFDSYQNNLTVLMSIYPGSSSSNGDTSQTTIHKCSISNIPIQKWTNLTISVLNRTLDIYLDGKLVRTCVMPGVPRVNSNTPLFLTPNGGFSGHTAKLQYWPTSCEPQRAWDIYKDGYGGGVLNLFEKLKLKISFMENNVEVNSLTV